MNNLEPDPDPTCARESCKGRALEHIDTINNTETWVCPICKQRAYFHIYAARIKPVETDLSRPHTLAAQLAMLSPAARFAKVEKCVHCQLTTAVDGDHLCAVCRVLNDHYVYGGQESAFVQ